MDANSLTATIEAPAAKRTRERNPKARGVFEKVPGSGVYWIRYTDAQGRYRREKAGTKGVAIDLYRKRKMEALTGKKLPEKLRRATVTFADIAKDALAYSKQHKRDYRHDAGRMSLRRPRLQSRQCELWCCLVRPEQELHLIYGRWCYSQRMQHYSPERVLWALSGGDGHARL